ncbi:winged helix-turn-helix domain-containing protein [Aeromonas caviae]|uniref:winged helix-turn-helix domain-containing protein n=1 Tax=Aeromonas caviae TaxID=648 RepID=UPI00313D377B
MFEEVSNSIKAYLYERAVSPLMGGFIVSWCLWNYKLLLLIISDTPVLEKFRIINEGIYPTHMCAIIYGIALPTITALAYIYIYPYPAEYVFRHSQKRQKRLSDIKREVEGNTLLSVNESRELRHKQYALEEQYNIEIDKKDNEIESLKKDIIALRKQNIMTSDDTRKNKTRWSPDGVNLTKEEEEILVNIEKHSMNENDIIEIFDNNISPTNIKYHIGSLEYHGLISAEKEKSTGYDLYSITHEGRAYIVEILKQGEHY